MDTNLLVIFATGLFTGGLTCLAVQGGLLATTLAQQEEERLKEGVEKKSGPMALVWFLGAKLIAYTILGFLLGALGSVLELSTTASIILQTAVIIFMLGTAGNLLDLHPFFRYFVIQPPRALTRMVRTRAKSRSMFAPALLGAFTIFIPCGTTQAMMALAISSGSPLTGALILFAFVLGTTPIFFILGYFMTRLGDALQKKFYRFAAVAIILLALWTLNGTLAIAGLPNFSTAYASLTKPSYFVEQLTETEEQAANDVRIRITDYGYSPSVLTVKAGEPVTLTLENKDGYTCAASFMIPSLGLRTTVMPGQTKTLEFTPEKAGKIPFMCSMGMYRGVINVK